MKFICPLIVVDDIGVSRRFYEEVLGQRVLFDHGENVSFEGGFAIHLKSHFAGLVDVMSMKLSTKQIVLNSTLKQMILNYLFRS